MGGHYEKGLFDQLMEVQARLEAMELEHKKDRNEIKLLRMEVTSLCREKEKLQEELTRVKEENHTLRIENEKLREENRLLRDDNERMKRIMSNNSSNSSLPPSSDPSGKAPNTYNNRKKTGKSVGGQVGHPGRHLSKAEVEQKIREGLFEHRLEEIGKPGSAYVTRYRLDLEIKTIATEIRIYADENGKYQIPDEMKTDVFYGKTIQAITCYLYSEGVVANDRICDLINSLSGDSLHISTGCIYGFCVKFGLACESVCSLKIEEDLLNSEIVCTDATTITTNGEQTYIRNFSTAKSVLYVSADKKNLETMNTMRIFQEFSGTFIHDHETAVYHYGTGHAECNVHIARYLKKNTEETGNTWSQDMSDCLQEMNCARNVAIERGETQFTAEQIDQYEQRYKAILSLGEEQNSNTNGKTAQKEEKKLLNRMGKYMSNHLLFLHDFNVPFSNNMSERDLRKCKNRQKMAGGFRTNSGRQMYCHVMSFVETVKRRNLNILHCISALLNGAPILD